MRHVIRPFLTIALVAVAAFVAAPRAHASTTISGVFTGGEVFPDEVEHLRYIARWKAQARRDHARAQQRGDYREMRIIEADWRLADRDEQESRAVLRLAQTRVTLYGDAGTRMSRADILRLLRSGQTWEHAHIHIWQKQGRLSWDVRAPRGGFDDRRSAGTSAGNPPYGQTIKVGGIHAAPLGIPVTQPRAGTRPAGGRQGSSSWGRKQPTTGTLFGF